jgi:Flp pilus assembly protein TadG
MRLRLANRGERDERGAIAVLTALMMVVFLAVAALGVDITTQVNQRQKLHDTIDAAAHDGAYRLPTGAQARSDALASAATNYPGAPVPAVALFCVVASKLVGGIWVVDTTQIPATCNPVSAGGSYTGIPCNFKPGPLPGICAIPCDGASDVCNTIRVTGQKPVPFSFAPVFGVTQGGTGAVTSVACKGSCGTIPPNPMDVAVVADRTSSMNVSGHDYDADLRDGILGMLSVMTPSQQYVALGTIGRSATTTHSTASCDSSNRGLSYPSGSDTTGAWIPVNFSNNYLNADKTVKVTDPLVKGINCLTTHSSTGTHLASPMKAAARYLLGPSSPYDSTTSYPAGASARTGTIQKAIIFETDGAPNESNFGGSTALNDPADIGSTDGATACTNLTTVATNAKNNNILVVTVAFNIQTTDLCGGRGSARLDQTLAAAASPAPSGAASAANFDCGTPAGRTSENSDGDYFFCAGTGTDMAPIFKTALGQLAKGIRMIQLPP